MIIEKNSLLEFKEVDKKLSEIFPSSFYNGDHLALLFTMAHNSLVRGQKYKNNKKYNELELFTFLRDHSDIEISVENIIKMHATLTNSKSSSFKKVNVQIKADNGLYIPTSAEKTPQAMEELCENFKHLNHPKEGDFEDIFKFILQFICIHPFENGNGRLSTFLTELLLTKFGLSKAIYLPFDALLNGVMRIKTTQAIRNASGFFYGFKELEYEPYISYMKETLMTSYKLLFEAAKKVNEK